MALRDKLREVISANDAPGKIALSFAVGVFLGMSPLLGLHTALGFAAAWLFRLNKFVTIVGVFITNPWTIVPIYTFATWLGVVILGTDNLMPAFDWNNVSFSSLMGEMKPFLWPFVFGSTLVGIVSAAVGYLIVYHAVVRNRR